MRSRWSNERGFGMVELVVVVGLIAVISILAAPSFLQYWQSARLGAGADELASILGQARALAIRENRTYCVERTGTDLRFRFPTCAGPNIWIGPGSDGAGAFRLSNGLQVTAGGPVIFTGTGGATSQQVFTVTNPTTAAARNVTVTTTGRMTW
jgi:Tfp pilus assembly protein FimT